MTADLERHRANDGETRRLIRELLDETLFVEAGAGTGKTSALVDRYLSLVLAGRRVEELVAITFTEKAAAELRERVRGELEHRQAIGDGDAALDEALVSLDRAQISTIHAFAMNVLRSFAAETGINPSFSVQDEVAAERRFEEAWRAYLEHLGQDVDTRRIVNRLLELGLWTSDLQRLAQELWRHTALSELLQASSLTAPAAVWPDLEALGRRLLVLNLDGVVEGDLLASSIREVLYAVVQLIAADEADRETLLATLSPSLKVSGYGKATNWYSAVPIATARETAKEICEILETTLRSMRSEALADALPLLVRFVVEETRARLRDGSLVFDDLIVQLRNILRDNPAARRQMRSRYRALMIDEFQDTDPVQTEIALHFARDPDTGAIEPGRVFLVGDPKQSIYRFRSADMTVYSQTKATVSAAGARTPELALNRRSRGVVLAFVNETFEQVIGHGDNAAVQPAYRPVHPERNASLAGPNVGWIGGPRDEQAREVRRQEAAQVAAYCRAALEQGWQVESRQGVRGARYQDIAILVPTRAILQPLERALAEAGVPFRVEGGSLVYATQEVRDLINCLTAIDDPTDDIAIVGALRSPVYACSDVDLARHRLDGGTFNYLSPDLNNRIGRVADSLVDLRTFHLDRHTRTLAALVERFVAAHSAVEAGIYDSSNRNAFRRARFVVEQARLFEAEGPESLRAFVGWLERRAGDAILDHEGAGLDDDEDAVRVLTIHAAKGLEFPIVIVAGLGVSPSNLPATLGMDRATGAIAVSIGSKARNHSVGPVDDINQQEATHQKAERDRLLYVATTRARDHLIVSLYHNQRASNTAAQSLIAAGACNAASELPELSPVRNAALVPFANLEVEADDLTDEAFDQARRDLVRKASLQIVTSATALGRRLAIEADPDAAEREDESEPWARGRAGTHRGRAVHAALQVLPWDADDATIRALAAAQAVAEAIPDEAARVEELLHRALVTEAAARARAAGRALREVPFAYTDEGVIVEGFMDLVLDGDDGIEVIDWKTDAVAPGAVAQRLESYRLQAGLYVLGLEAATGRRVSRVTYVFVSPGVEASPGDPAELAAAARQQVAALKQDRAS